MSIGLGHTWAVQNLERIGVKLPARGCFMRCQQPVTIRDFDEPRTARRERAGEVLRYATDERVEGDHSARAGGEHGVGEVRADHSRAAGDDDARAGESAHFLIRFTFIVR